MAWSGVRNSHFSSISIKLSFRVHFVLWQFSIRPDPRWGHVLAPEPRMRCSWKRDRQSAARSHFLWDFAERSSTCHCHCRCGRDGGRRGGRGARTEKMATSTLYFRPHPHPWVWPDVKRGEQTGFSGHRIRLATLRCWQKRSDFSWKKKSFMTSPSCHRGQPTPDCPLRSLAGGRRIGLSCPVEGFSVFFFYFYHLDIDIDLHCRRRRSGEKRDSRLWIGTMLSLSVLTLVPTLQLRWPVPKPIEIATCWALPWASDVFVSVSTLALALAGSSPAPQALLQKRSRGKGKKNSEGSGKACGRRSRESLTFAQRAMLGFALHCFALLDSSMTTTMKHFFQTKAKKMLKHSHRWTDGWMDKCDLAKLSPILSELCDERGNCTMDVPRQGRDEPTAC